MRIGVYAELLPSLGGAEKHGLLLLEPLLGLHDITVYYRGATDINLGAIEKRFGICLPGVRLRRFETIIPITGLSAQCDLFVNISWASTVPSRAPRSILMVFFPAKLADTARCTLYERLLHKVKRFQGAILDWAHGVEPRLQLLSFREFLRRYGCYSAITRVPFFLLRRLAWLVDPNVTVGSHGIRTYDCILANSEYTARWTETYYRRSAVVNYPPIDVDRFRPAEDKQPLILSVGRFMPEPYSKKHHVSIQVFKELCDAGALPGWRMWVCGGLGNDRREEEYLDRLRRDAEGYPVSFGVNLTIKELAKLYGEASLYWHAMGYGEDPSEKPSIFEHFGMTTVEAMAAGCIPMVVAAGGQTEIVSHEVNGYCWDTTEGLKQLVRRFVSQGNADTESMRHAARERAQDFRRAEFFQRACEVYDFLGVAHRSCADEDPRSIPRSSRAVNC